MIGTRDRILDALEDMLLEHGQAGATLDAVAARAEVSKGGLLYHFGSKEALYQGLLERLSALTTQDIGSMPEDVEAGVRQYLAYSHEVEDGYTRSLLAALRLLGAKELEGVHVSLFAEQWHGALTRLIADPVTARIVQLVGDGLYLQAIIGAERLPIDVEVEAWLLERVRRSAEQAGA